MSVKRVSQTQGEIKRWRQAENRDLLKGDVGVNDSITVSSAWELTSVSMHYSQGNGVHTPLSRLVLYPRSVCVLLEYISVILDYPWHGYVLYRAIIIKTCVYTIYTCRAEVPVPHLRPSH